MSWPRPWRLHEPYVLQEQYEPLFLWDDHGHHVGGGLLHVDGFDDGGGHDDDDGDDVVLLLLIGFFKKACSKFFKHYWGVKNLFFLI